MLRESVDAVSHPAGLRPVDRFVDHGKAMDFAELLPRVLPTDATHVVFDLDRTIHLGRNIGELLGWELSAYQSYGADALERLEPTRQRSRFLFDTTQPRGLVRYLYDGVRRWARPGLTYFVWGKVASRREPLRRLSFQRFGPEPVRVVQREPQETLLGHMEEASPEELAALSRRLLERYTPDQVIERTHIDAIRRRCPGAVLVLASASPTAVVAEAAARLGMDAYTGSTRDHINSGPAKVAELARRFPAMFAPGAVRVGFTDTGYGEDHVWADHFHVLVDVNSDTPFSPLVSLASPLRALHSARVLTREEKDRRAQGEDAYLDPRRRSLPRAGQPRDLDASGLRLELGDLLAQVDALRVRLSAEPRRAAYQMTRLLEQARRRLDWPEALPVPA